MTQAELAGKIGVTDKAVSRWERGLGFPDINTMEPLADALGISLLELMRSEVQDADNDPKAETMSREGWNSQKEQNVELPRRTEKTRMMGSLKMEV